MNFNKKLWLALACFFMIGLSYAQDQKIKVSGTVTDSQGMPLPGVTIMEKGTANGTSTDFDGNYLINIPAAKSNILEFSYISFETQSIPINSQTDVVKNIIMKTSQNELEEIVVVGFGRKKKENLTGAVSQVGEEVFESRPVLSADKALQGAVAGLNISTDAGGELDGNLDINIRGIGTIGEGSSGSPLVLIDGIEGDLNTINPNDIKNISVLKDAAAASIYGSRAPFGVILVTTKEGVQGKTRINYSTNFRYKTPINVPERMNSLEYAYMLNDLYVNTGRNPIYNENRIDLIKSYRNGDLAFGTEPNSSGTNWTLNRAAYGDEDWYNIHLKDLSLGQEHNLSVNGGSEKITYYTSANFLTQEGIFHYSNEDFDRFSLNAKINAELSDKFDLSLNTRFMRKNQDRPTAQGSRFYHNLSRSVPTSPLYTPYGEYMENSMVQQLTDGGRFKEQTDYFYNTIKLTYEPIEDWKIYGQVNSRIENHDDTKHIAKISVTQPTGESEYIPVFSGYVPNIETRDWGISAITAPGQNYYQVNNGQVNYLGVNFYSDYETSFGDHNFTFLLGAQSELYQSHFSQLGTDNIESDDTPFISQNGEKYVFESKGTWSNVGVFSRINYDYKQRYLLEANFRADGASRFPSDERWGYFPSFSAGWNIAKEAFWDDFKRKVSELKIRGSWGMLGNQNTNSFYPYFQNMSIQNGNWIVNDNVPSSIYAPRPFSSSITWEKIISYNYGFDIAAFNNRLTASADIFERKTKDMVGPAPLKPGTFGTVVPRTNNAELVSKGWELSLGWKDRINDDFSYNANVVVSDVKSEVTEYSNPDKIIMVNGRDQFYKGKNIGEIWGYESAGIAKSDLEMNQWLESNKPNFGSNWAGGDMKYKDLNGDNLVDAGARKLDDRGDLTRIGNSTPRYTFGINLGFEYKAFDFRAFVQGVGKRDVLLSGGAFYPGINQWQISPYSAHLDYFRAYGADLGANLDSYYPRPFIGDKNYKAQTHFLQDASYVRLKNVQIGFNVPNQLLKKWGFQNLRLYISGENIYTHTNLRMFDPEGIQDLINGSGKTYPMSATFSTGLNVTF
ncbi:TonB-linked outer membrane protein, SusC/RagA family [Salegentibacter holothuriorum]|uniref:TonB-linked outer membrane protein, SusC/RagA family n=1 Tax=Salegentibacter holothuriorum TaxID=241145 RepID=A0A1T5DK81_9FLAO|nr:TonB-dependent receptor [Salegentibacter holothuriorum]SKB71853.1 TonB-linked outer membrane protein, SusC/RagA family [Salegentibacter holothuriorum]